MPHLGVNIDHVATLRQARGEDYPDPVAAITICEKAGAHSIVAHLREDRRHINDTDIKRIRKKVTTRFNMELSVNREIVAIAAAIRPDQATLVPERRQEITTEGGLDVTGHFTRIKQVTKFLQKQGIAVSLFIDPDQHQIRAAGKLGSQIIELHTGDYAKALTPTAAARQLKRLKHAAALAYQLGLRVHAGHGLNYQNTRAVAHIPHIDELNIGHAIISRAVFVGLKDAVKEMCQLL